MGIHKHRSIRRQSSRRSRAGDTGRTWAYPWLTGWRRDPEWPERRVEPGEGGTAMRLASGATCGLGPECECDLGWCRGAYRKYRNSHRRWIHRTLVVGTSSVLIPASARLVGIHQRAGHAHRARALGEDSSCQIADIASDRAGCLRLQIQSLE